MTKLSKVLRSVTNNGLMFYCPACKINHIVYVGEGSGPRWSYNNNPHAPTFNPSVRVASGHYNGPSDSCWCTYNKDKIAKGEEPSPFKCGTCHSQITDGVIQYYGDSTHSLAGMSVDIPILPDEGD